MDEERKKDVDNNRFYAAISYLWILCFVPLIWRRRSEFAMHHARQGLVLLLAGFFFALIAWIPLFGYFLSMLFGLATAILAFLGIINALNGKYWQMPALGRYAKKIRI